MMKVLSSLFLLPALLIPASLFAQVPTGSISGIVTNEVGQPLASVQVSVPGTPRGTLTRSDGRYLLTAVTPGERTLRATLIGYGSSERTVSVIAGETATADFRLVHRAVELEGIVAVGYGVQQRHEVTGAVASVSQARLEDVPNTNVLQALQGAAPGVHITNTGAGAEPQFNLLIRGMNSITASNEPLIVVDGLPYSGNLGEINQTDVASIDILRDASATAIYGARGANGVVLITTRRGRVGTPTISYEGQAGMAEIAHMPRLMTGPEYAEFKCQRVAAHTPCDEIIYGTERENLEAGRFVDWIDLATRRGIQHQHNLSFSGGSEQTRFYISGAALDNEGISVGDQFQRYTLRLNLEQQLSSWLDVGINTQLSHTDRSGETASFGTAFYSSPLINPYEPDGSVALTPWPEDPERSNPLQNINILNDDISRRVIVGGFAEGRLPFVDGLSYRFNAGVDFMNRETGRYFPRTTRVGQDNQGRSIATGSRAFDWTVENILRFSRAIGAHNVDVTGLFSAQANNFERNETWAQGFPNDVLTYRQAHLASVVQPSYDVLNSGLLSQMGRVNYGYDGRYMVTLTARRDGYSGFGEHNKYGVFPSLAVAWNVSGEPFWGFDRMNELRLRLSYGQNGNHAILPYQTLARLAEDPYLAGGTSWPGFFPAALGNPDLRWETTTSLNGGVDFGFLANRLRGSLDAYTAETHDLLLDRLVSPVHGIERIVDNIGRVKNRGIELGLSGLPIETPRFSWMVDFNVSANRNQIIDLYGDFRDDVVNQWFVGQPIRTHFGWQFDGVWQEGDDIANSAQPSARPGDARVFDLNGDGVIDADDRTVLGNEEPNYIAGLSNTMRYGNVSLNFFINAVQGVTRFHEDLLPEVSDPRVRRNTLYLDYWTPQNPMNTRWANREDANLFRVGLHQDASFVRLRDLTLSYDLPPALAGRLGSSGLRIYGNGRNLWMRTNWIGLDPELDAQRARPLERLFTVGVNASF
jgi:TonB-linked SusC/RagA family outer membrane protein